MRLTTDRWFERMRFCWNYAAAGSRELEEWLEHHYAPLNEAMLRMVPVPAGGRVLELTCGTGSFARRLAQHASEVVGTDLAPEMIEVARASAEGLSNVRFHVHNAEQPVPEPGPFDAAYSRLGLMMCPDPVAAFRSIRDAVGPGGTFAFAVWGPDTQNQWSEAMSRPLFAYHGLKDPDPKDPNAFRLSDPYEVVGMLRSAGWEPFAHEPVLVPGWGDGGPEAAFERIRRIAGPIGTLWERTPDADKPALREQVIASLAAVPAGGLTGVAWVHASRRPA